MSRGSVGAVLVIANLLLGFCFGRATDDANDGDDSTKSKEQKKKIVILLANLGYEDVSWFSSNKNKKSSSDTTTKHETQTPNIGSLGETGLTLTNHWSVSSADRCLSWCLSSRCRTRIVVRRKDQDHCAILERTSSSVVVRHCVYWQVASWTPRAVSTCTTRF